MKWGHSSVKTTARQMKTAATTEERQELPPLRGLAGSMWISPSRSRSDQPAGGPPLTVDCLGRCYFGIQAPGAPA